MGKRSCTYNPAAIEEGIALRSMERRSRQVAFFSKTKAMSLLALRTELPSVFSEETGAFPLKKPHFPRLQPQRQGKALTSITDDEDEIKKNNVVASKKPDMFRVGHSSLTTLALRKPILSIAGTRRRETPTHRKVPFGRPIPPALPFGRPIPSAPMLPSLLLSRRVIPSTKKS
jgi:hypothetical protein